MTQAITPNQNKRLSELKQIAVDIVSGIQSVIMNRDIINKRLEQGRALGFSDIEIGDAIRRESKGKLSDVTVRKYLPETAKHMQMSRPPIAKPPFANVQKSPNQNRLVVPEEPTIPPRPETVVEVEPEPPKPIDEPIAIPKIIEVIFDPAPIDRDRTQVFIMQIDPIAKKVIKYKAVGRRSIAG